MRELPMPTLPLSQLIIGDKRRSPVPAAPARPEAAPVLEATWARSEDEVREAQRLRYRVFVSEMGARLDVPAGAPKGHDVDRFDAFCEHLLVRAPGRPGAPGPVIGTYRLMTPDASRRAGGLYSETEFDLRNLEPLRSRMVELGRSCVDPAWRSGGAIMTLWGALAEFMVRNKLDTMVGCASVGIRDGGHSAASLWEKLRQTHLAAPEWHVTPRLPLPVNELDRSLDVEPPALIKGYLRCGAKLLGAPAWDPDFNTADLPLMMRTADLPARYLRHFMGA
jgi:putative hemolysin